MDQNLIVLVGRLVRPPEYFPAGRRGDPHATFLLVVNRVVPNANGPQADYFPCVLWGEEAKQLCETRGRGDEIGIVGRIRTELLSQPGGKTQFRWEVRVDEIHFGRRSLKNLAPPPEQTPQTRAVARLHQEFRR